MRYALLACLSSGWAAQAAQLSPPAAATPRKVNLRRAFDTITEPWSPHVAGDVNSCQLKLARMEGEFVWHHHEAEDEAFLVVRGRMRMRFRDADGVVTDVDCDEGEMIVVPAGLDHCPVALSESADVLLVEQSGTLNTGSAADELGETAHAASKEGVPLTKKTLKRVD